jgi:hypothetical protein
MVPGCMLACSWGSLIWRSYLWVIKRDPLGCWQIAVVAGSWRGCLTDAQLSAAATWDAQHGVVICAGLEAAGRDDLLSHPDLECEERGLRQNMA